MLAVTDMAVQVLANLVELRDEDSKEFVQVRHLYDSGRFIGEFTQGDA